MSAREMREAAARLVEETPGGAFVMALSFDAAHEMVARDVRIAAAIRALPLPEMAVTTGDEPPRAEPAQSLRAQIEALPDHGRPGDTKAVEMVAVLALLDAHEARPADVLTAAEVEAIGALLAERKRCFGTSQGDDATRAIVGRVPGLLASHAALLDALAAAKAGAASLYQEHLVAYSERVRERDAAREEAAGLRAAVEEALAMGTPWPLYDVLDKLVGAARYLLVDLGSDHHGHEVTARAMQEGVRLLPAVRALSRAALTREAPAPAPCCTYHESGGHPDDRHGRDPVAVVAPGPTPEALDEDTERLIDEAMKPPAPCYGAAIEERARRPT